MQNRVRSDVMYTKESLKSQTEKSHFGFIKDEQVLNTPYENHIHMPQIKIIMNLINCIKCNNFLIKSVLG